LGFNGLTPFGEQITQGAPIPPEIALDPATCLLLSHEKTLLPPTESQVHPLDFKLLVKVWPEQTTTSPSGQHLGVYKSLLKDLPPSNPPPDYKPCMHGIDIMCYIYHLLKLGLQHTHAYERWKVIWNMYLEKILGSQYINHIQTLHLFEADYNLLLKWHSSQGFLPKAEKNHHLHDSQGGGWPGHSTIDLACQTSII